MVETKLENDFEIAEIENVSEVPSDYKSSIPISKEQIERTVCAIEKFGNLCESVKSPNALRLVEAFMKLSSASHMAAASIASDKFDARRIKADSLNFSVFVENIFDKVKEMVSSGGGSKKEDASSVEPPKYFSISIEKDTGKQAYLDCVNGLWVVAIDGIEKTVGFTDPQDAINEWNKINV